MSINICKIVHLYEEIYDKNKTGRDVIIEIAEVSGC